MGQIGSLWYNIGAKTASLEKGLSNSKNKFVAFGNSAKASFTEINQGLEILQKAGQVFGDIYTAIKRVLEINDEYTTSMIDGARLTGMTTEVYSRFANVADDVFVSQENLNTALMAASRKGIDTSIKGITKLSDQYLQLNPGVDRAKDLMDNFGRSGAEMGKLLEIGSQSIIENMKAIDGWLVVSDEAVKRTNAYKRSVDAAQDSNKSFAISVANGTMPAVTDLNVRYSEMVDAVTESGKAVSFLTTLSEGLQQALLGVQVVFGGYTTEADLATEATKKLSTAISGIPEVKAFTSRGSIYDQTYGNAPNTNRGSIYDKPEINAGGASGLNMVVPAGYPNDTFKIGASTGEQVSIGKNNNESNKQLENLNVSIKMLPKIIAREIRQLEKYG